jgi:heterodisulfide reductase subunit B
MLVSYYPGCSLHGIAREYDESTQAAVRVLGVELKELDDWNCCGASSAHVTDDALATALPARNLGIAAAAGTELVVPCAACYSRLKAAQAAEPETRGDGLRVRHLADFLWEAVGEKAVSQKVVRPIEGLSVVCYYGCLVTRPPKVTGAADPDNPESMDGLVRALGADVRDWSYKTDCCGASHVLTLPAVAWRLIQKLLDMAEEAGADCIVVGCPMCHTNLDSAQADVSKETGREYAIPIIYFTELMALAFADPSAEKQLARHMVDPRPLLRQKGLI